MISAETKIVGGELMKPEAGRPSWKNRRRVIFLTLFFCAFCILYIMMYGDGDSRVHETIVLGAFGLAFTTIGFYVAGAAWTDINIEKIKATERAPEGVMYQSYNPYGGQSPVAQETNGNIIVEVEPKEEEDNR